MLYEMRLPKGWNFISFPGEPTSKNLMDILLPVCAVAMAYDAADEDSGDWLPSVRTGHWCNRKWQGTLCELTAGVGCIVLCLKPAHIKVDLEPAVLAVQIVNGWNLIGVADSEIRPHGEPTASIEDYLRGQLWQVAHFPRHGGVMSDDQDEFHRIMPGRGYKLLSGSAGWVWGGAAEPDCFPPSVLASDPDSRMGHVA